jgi:small subunit ribosomal protein S5
MQRFNLSEEFVENKENAFVDHVICLRRVVTVTKGGKRFSFSACVVSGNRRGLAALGLGNSKEPSLAVAKAVSRARKRLIQVPLRGTTVPYGTIGKHGASKVIIRPASKGTGNIAGGAVRSVLDAVGVVDVLTKSFGSSNGLNIAKATFNALARTRSAGHIAKLRGKSVREIVGEKNAAAQ